jgi:sugar phosphate isomerase/epimerase
MAAPLALQLYTVREALQHDFAGTLRRVAEIGYRGVETAFFEPNITPRYARQCIEELGLTICSIHCDLPLGAQREQVVSLAAELGSDRLVWHGWPRDPRYRSLDGISALVAEYNAAAALAKQAGLRMGIHNHWWECEQVDGVLPYQVFLQQLDPAIFFELDTYWAQVAGRDPIAMLHELGPRAALVHLKDGPATHDAPKMAVGAGVMDIPGIVAASAAHAEWLIVELDDCASDMLDAVAQSYTYLTSHGLAIGKG